MLIDIYKSSILESIEIVKGRDIYLFMFLTKKARIGSNINFETIRTIIKDNARIGEETYQFSQKLELANVQ